MKRSKTFLSPGAPFNSEEDLGMFAPPVYLSHARLSYHLGKVVSRRRVELGFSQQAFTRGTGLRQVRHIEGGRQNPTLRTLARVAAGLEWRLSELCTAIETDPSEAEETFGGSEANKVSEEMSLSISRALYQLGKAVRVRRIELGSSTEELATRSGLGRCQINYIESARRNVKLHTLGRICVGLRLKLSELFAAIQPDSDDTENSPSAPNFHNAAEIPTLSELPVYGGRELLLHQLGDVVRERRFELQISRATLAERCGLSKSLYDLEAGKRNVYFDTLFRLSVGLDWTLSELCAAIEVHGKAEPKGATENHALAAPRVYCGFEQLTCQLGKLVNRRRNELGLSRVVIAERAGLDVTQIQHIEAGGQNPTLLTLVRLCAGLDMRLSELFVAIEVRAE